MNRKVILKQHATGLPTPDLFDIVEAPVPEPADGEVVTRNAYVTVDPAGSPRATGWSG